MQIPQKTSGVERGSLLKCSSSNGKFSSLLICSSNWNKKFFSALQEKVALSCMNGFHLAWQHHISCHKERTQNARADGCAVQTKRISPINTALLSRVLQMFIRKRCSWWLSAPCPKAFCIRMPDPLTLPPARNLTVVIHSAAHSPFLPIPPSLQKIILNSVS